MKSQIENLNTLVPDRVAHAAASQSTIDTSIKLPDIFVTTLQACDLGPSLGSAGGLQIHIPIEARLASPQFWGWPDDFSPVQNVRQTNLRERPLTVELLDGKIYESQLVGYAARKEFELHLEAASEPFGLRMPGELLILVRGPDSGADFLLHVVRKKEPFHGRLLGRCQKRVEVSDGHRRFGYFDMDFAACPPPGRRVWVVIQHRPQAQHHNAFEQKSQAIEDCRTIERSNGPAEVVPLTEQV